MSIYNKIDAYKTAIDRQGPFEGETLKHLRDYYRIGLTWSSNAIEGNTLTISETKIILEEGLTVGGHPLREMYETVGHGQAYDFMLSLADRREITIDNIKTLHHMFYKSIDEKNAGHWRKVPIIVTGTDYVFPKPETLDKEMQKLESWIQTERGNYHPAQFAAILHLKFVSIHPFVDGNGRVSRLIMNLSLIQDGYLLAIIPPVRRLEYLDSIRIYQNQNQTEPFCQFIAERVFESEKEIMRLLHIPMPQI